MKEATARIKINKLLEAAGWRFLGEDDQPANIQLEPSVTIKSADLDALGNDFEKTSKGFVDFLLLDTKGFPLIVPDARLGHWLPVGGRVEDRVGTGRAGYIQPNKLCSRIHYELITNYF